jgi:hypothetical protein
MHSAPLRPLLAALALALALPPSALSYPLDGYEYTGIFRLEAQRLVQIGKAKGRKRPPGELLPMKDVDLRLLDHPDFQLPPPDPALTAKVKRLLGQHVNDYGIGLLDLSDMAHVRYAEWNGDKHQNPGSVGKILVALALFQALADIYPDDIEARERVLRQTVVTADVFSVYDHHTVPKHDAASGRVYREPIHEGDQASLWTYVDWMMSPSSNSAAGMIQKQLILLAHYGAQYPPSEEEQKRFFDETPRAELAKIFEKAIQEPVTRNGLDLGALRQGSFFTHQGKIKVPGTSSYATPHELMNFMVKLEQGKLVDRWSSREIKRLMYITERRIRYASSWTLKQSAVYFKSGSLYSCQPEEGFVCKKYHGNKRNYMNSIAIIESPAGENKLFYMAAVLSNVLRMNSAQDHRDLARAIQQQLMADHPGSGPSKLDFGKDFIGYAEERKGVELAAQTQEALLALGYEIGDIDGVIGSKTRAAIKTFQKSQGLAANGVPSDALLQRMKKVALDKGLVRPEITAEGN